MPSQTPEERFWPKVRVDQSSDAACWEWQAYRNRKGYGQFGYEGQVLGAHRVAWILAYGPIPDGLCVCHRCDNPRCVRPSHLFLGTIADNTYDMIAKGRNRAPKGDQSGSRLHPERRARGERQWKATLTEDLVRQIREGLARGERNRHIARRLGVSEHQVHFVKAGKAWKHVQ